MNKIAYLVLLLKNLDYSLVKVPKLKAFSNLTSHQTITIIAVVTVDNITIKGNFTRIFQWAYANTQKVKERLDDNKNQKPITTIYIIGI